MIGTKDEWALAIVGAGPAGLSTALFLHDAAPEIAARTIVLEKATHPREKICAGAIGARADRLLEAIGVRVDVPSAPIRGIAVTTGGGHLVVRAEREVGRVVRRSAFDAALADVVRARGILIREGSGVRAIQRTARGVELSLDDGERVTARAIVGADGVGSAVRRGMGVARGSLYAQVAEIDTVRTPRDLADDLVLFDLSNRGLRGYAWDFPTPLHGAIHACRGVYELAERGEERAAHVDVSAVLAERVGTTTTLGHSRRFAERGLSLHEPCSKERVLLAGEAAGIDPVLGEGIAQAIFYGSVAGPYLARRLRTDHLRFDDWRRELLRSRLGLDLRLRTASIPLVYGRGRNVLERWVSSSDSLARAGLEYFAGERVPRTLVARAIVDFTRALWA